jgi:hypothetical protein
VQCLMLRQALDDHQADEARGGGGGGTNSASSDVGLPSSGGGVGYGSADPATRNARTERIRGPSTGDVQEEEDPHEHDEGQSTVDEGSDDEEEDDEEDDDDDEDDEDDEDENDAPLPRYLRLWQAVKSGIRIVANVENLWDESVTPDSSTSSSRRRSSDVGAPVDSNHRQDGESRSRYQRDLELHLRDSVASQHHYPYYFRTRNLIVLFWFVVLASSYAAERSTYKLLVDRAGPFRLLAVEMVTFTHSVMLLSAVLLAKFVKDPTSDGGRQHSRYVPPPSPHHAISLGISIIDVALMAFLESIQLILVFLTGLHVPPTLTVILIQFTLPLTAFLTQFVHPQGRCRCSPSAGSDSESAEARNVGVDATPPPPPPPGDPYRDASYRNASLDHRNDETERLLSQGYQFASTNDDPAASSAESNTRNTCGGLSSEHVYGSLIIFLAVVLALIPAFYSIARPDFFEYAGALQESCIRGLTS